MKILLLTKGCKTIVDDDDYEMLSHWRWFASRNRSGRIYAARMSGPHDGKMKKIYLHRLVMRCRDDQSLDHINGNSLDNRKINLRFATQSQNLANSGPRNIKKTSIYKGVSRFRSKWVAFITINGTTKNLGTFKNEQEAGKEYDRAAFAEWGEFAWLNFPRMPRRGK